MRILIAAAMLAAAPVWGGQAQPDTLTPGTVEVVVDAPHAHAAIDRVFANAVSEALSDARFLVLPGEGHGRYIAHVTVTRQARGTVAAETKSGGDVTAASGRLGVSLPATKTQLAGLVVTRLEVRLVLRETGEAVWSGSASTAQIEGTAAGAPAAVAAKLAEAVVRRFPQATDGAISVP